MQGFIPREQPLPLVIERLALEGFPNGAESLPLTSILPPGGLVNGKTRLGLLCSVVRVCPVHPNPHPDVRWPLSSL